MYKMFPTLSLSYRRAQQTSSHQTCVLITYERFLSHAEIALLQFAWRVEVSLILNPANSMKQLQKYTFLEQNPLEIAVNRRLKHTFTQKK